MIRYGLAWGPMAAWLMVLYALSAQPEGTGATSWPLNDTVAHLGLYGILGITLAWGRFVFRGQPGRLVLVALGLIWALSDEWHQSFVPGRTAAVDDLVADAVGLLLGLLIASRAFPLLLPDTVLPFRRTRGSDRSPTA